MGINKKRRRYLLLFILVIVFISVAGLAKIVPVYPAFQKQVHSKEQIGKRFNDCKEVIIPQIEMPGKENTVYFLNLDGRTLLSRPIGYLISATSNNEGQLAMYVLNCTIKQEDIQGDVIQYKNFPIQINRIRNNCTLKFSIGNHLYTIDAFYNANSIDNNESYNELFSDSIAIVHNIIDQYTE